MQAQVKYYVATGKDSITYIATNLGLIIMDRQQDGSLQYHSFIDDSNKVYTRALDNDNYLIFGTNNYVDIYSIENKFYPQFIGTINIANIKSIRPFGLHFAVLRGDGFLDQYIVGVENDSAKILTGLEAKAMGYSGRTLWYPEVVYPYIFRYKNEKQLLMHRYSEADKEFLFVDTLTISSDDYNIIQLYGAPNNLFVSVAEYFNDYWLIYKKRYIVQNDTINYVTQNYSSSPVSFTDEIECTDKLIRFNGQYTLFTGQNLNEPNGFLASYANLSGDKIYNSIQFGVPLNTKFYYSTNIVGTTINSAELVLNPSAVNEGSLPAKFNLSQNYPNPFNPTTTIQYSVGSTQRVQLKIYDVLGNEIAVLVNEEKSPGNYSVEFDASNLSSGVYIYKITAGAFSSAKKLVLIK